MSKERVIAAIKLFFGVVTLETQDYLEVEYESMKNKLACEKILNRLGIVVLQGSTSDIGDKNKIHRVYLI